MTFAEDYSIPTGVVWIGGVDLQCAPPVGSDQDIHTREGGSQVGCPLLICDFNQPSSNSTADEIHFLQGGGHLF